MGTIVDTSKMDAVIDKIKYMVKDYTVYLCQEYLELYHVQQFSGSLEFCFANIENVTFDFDGSIRPSIYETNEVLDGGGAYGGAVGGSDEHINDDGVNNDDRDPDKHSSVASNHLENARLAEEQLNSMRDAENEPNKEVDSDSNNS